MAEEGDVVTVTSERVDVVVNPVQCCHNIGHACISAAVIFISIGFQVEKPEAVQSVVDGDYHDILGIGSL